VTDRPIFNVVHKAIFGSHNLTGSFFLVDLVLNSSSVIDISCIHDITITINSLVDVIKNVFEEADCFELL
jgi:hypothetical protein